MSRLDHPLYAIWIAMRNRCTNPKNPAWPHYGGRGISVCERWTSFECFVEDMGQRPSPEHSLDRKNVDGNYEPTNCRWATPQEQASNRRPPTEWRRIPTGRRPLADDVRRSITKRFRINATEAQRIEQALVLRRKELSDVAREQLLAWAEQILAEHDRHE